MEDFFGSHLVKFKLQEEAAKKEPVEGDEAD